MKRRLLFIVSEDWYFVSHRLHLGAAAVSAGFEVGVLTRVSTKEKLIRSAGIEVIDWRLNRRSRNPVAEARAIAEVLTALRSFRPDLIHAVALKPVLYSSLAAQLAGLRRRVMALGGLGFVHASSSIEARLLRPFVRAALRWALAGRDCRVILQNIDDLRFLSDANVINDDRVRLIRGSGVDTELFRPEPERAGVPVVLLPARLLWDKGVAEFVLCARKFQQSGIGARFVLVGEPDEHNPECIPRTQIQQWVAEGLVECWGWRDDMPRVFADTHIVCLPSYREGLPKALLEAASCGRPIVTFDVPGCREVVNHGDSGFLVPERNVEVLCESIGRLLLDSDLRARFGSAGREKVLREFSQERIAEETMTVWQELLA